MRWPSGRDLADPPGTRGMRLEPTEKGTGYIDDGTLAFPERIAEVRRIGWPEGRPEDFERVDRRRRWRDKATGTTYMRISGAPTLGDRSAEAVDCWFVEGGKIVFLIRESREAKRTRTIVHGPVRGGEVVDGRIVWSEK